MELFTHLTRQAYLDAIEREPNASSFIATVSDHLVIL